MNDDLLETSADNSEVDYGDEIPGPRTSTLVIYAILLGWLGIHDFKVLFKEPGILHIILTLVSLIIALMTGNILPIILFLPINLIWSVYEAVLYRQDYAIKIAREKIKLKNAPKNLTNQLIKLKEKYQKTTNTLWFFTLICAVLTIYVFLDGSKSASDGYLPEAISIFFLTPISVTLLICAIIQSIKLIMFKKMN